MTPFSTIRKTKHRMSPTHSGASVTALLQDKDCPPMGASKCEIDAVNQYLFTGNTDHPDALNSVLQKVALTKSHKTLEGECQEELEGEVPDMLASELDDHGLEWADACPSELSFLPAMDLPGQMPKKSWAARVH